MRGNLLELRATLAPACYHPGGLFLGRARVGSDATVKAKHASLVAVTPP